MKKVFSLILALALLFVSCAVCETIDFSSMSDEEVISLFNAVRNEALFRLIQQNKNTVIIDDDNIQIYFTGNGNYNTESFNLEVVIVNKTSSAFGVDFTSIVINGWETEFYFSSESIGGGYRKKCNIPLNYKDAEIDSYKQIDDIDVSFKIYNKEDYRTIKEYKNIIFNFGGENWD